MTATDISKAEKERLLDEKIKQMRLKNAQAEQRFREVDRDKALAEQAKSSITTAPKPKYDPSEEPATPPERYRNLGGGGGGSGNKAHRRQSDDHHDRVPAANHSTVAVTGPASSRGRGGAAAVSPPDPNGPPPDPGYRFLADRMREDDEAVMTGGGGGGGKRGQRGSGGGGGGAPATEGSAHSRLGSRLGRGSTGGGPGGGPGGGRGRHQNNRQSDNHRNRDPDSGDDDCFIVSETDRKGNIVSYYGSDPPSASKGGKFQNRKSMDNHTSPRVSATGAGGGGTGLSPGSKQSSTAAGTGQPKIKSLFDDDDEEEYYFPERWKGKEHHPKLFDTQRKIEQTSGGKLMVTRTMDPVARLESVCAKPSQSKLEHKEFMMKNDGGGKVLMSDNEWVCSDPACAHMNPPATTECVRCKLTFSRSNDYKKNLACDKYKLEFKKQQGGMSQQPGHLDTTPDPAGFTNGGGTIVVDPSATTTLPGATGGHHHQQQPQQLTPHHHPHAAPPHPHQFYPNSTPAAAEVSGWTASAAGVVTSDFNVVSAAGSEWTMSHLQQQHHDSSSTSAAADGLATVSWPSMQQELVLTQHQQQNFGIMMSHHHQPQLPPAAAATAGSFTSSNYFEQHAVAVAAGGVRPIDPAAAANQYYHHPPAAEFHATAAAAAPFVDHVVGAGVGGPQFSAGFAPAAASAAASNQFNPVAQAFVPTTTEPAKKGPVASLYQTPPPLLTGGGMMNRPPPPSNKSSDPNLLMSLSSPPKPLRINHLDPSKHIRSARASADDQQTGGGGGPQHSVNSRLSYKNTQQKGAVAPRFSKSREHHQQNQYYGGGSSSGGRSAAMYKPPSLMEMQSGTLKKRGGQPLSAPPPDKGNGVLVFGTSNVMNNLDPFKFSRYIGDIPVRLVPAMKLDLFASAVHEVDPARDWLVLIHGLGNDARNISLKMKSEAAKGKEADEVANLFCDLIENRILALSPHLRVLISLLLPRYDFEEKPGMSNPNNVRKVINVAITERFYENPRVHLINSDDRLLLDTEEHRAAVMGTDGYHLTQEGFKKMVSNWIDHLMSVVRKAYPNKPIAPCEKTKAEAAMNVSSNNANSTSQQGGSGAGDDQLKLQQQTPSQASAATEPAGADDTTVPDPFGTYTAPVSVVSPGGRKDGSTSALLQSDDDLDDEDGIPSLETVDPPDADNALLASEENSRVDDTEQSTSSSVSNVPNPLLMETSEAEALPVDDSVVTSSERAAVDNDVKPADGVVSEEVESSSEVPVTPPADVDNPAVPDLEDRETNGPVTALDDTAALEPAGLEAGQEPVAVITAATPPTVAVDDDSTVTNSDVKSYENLAVVSGDSEEQQIKSEHKEIQESSENGLKLRDNVGDIEKESASPPPTVVKPVFKLGPQPPSAADELVNGVGGGEFIEDEYCSVLNGVGGTSADPLPSMINISGPESLNLASGYFLEDSYIDTSGLQNLNLAEKTTSNTDSPSSEACNTPIRDVIET